MSWATEKGLTLPEELKILLPKSKKSHHKRAPRAYYELIEKTLIALHKDTPKRVPAITVFANLKKYDSENSINEIDLEAKNITFINPKTGKIYRPLNFKTFSNIVSLLRKNLPF